ncbi:MAG: TolC family protein, partial [Cytophagales bacterium]
DAKLVLDGKIYSYQRGETSLLEVLNAQRTFIGVQQAYYQTLFAYAAALVELERVVGIWDLEF